MFHDKHQEAASRGARDSALGSLLVMSAERLKRGPRAAAGRGVSSQEREAPAESLGRRVARLRKEKGITQVELAETLGITQPVVSEYERDGLSFRWDQLVTLARLFRVTADELLGLSREAAPRRGPRDTRLARLVGEVEALPRRDRDALVRTIEAYLRPKTSPW